MPKITKSTNEEKRMNKKNKKEKYILKKLISSDVYQNETRIGKYDKESFVILDSTETIEELNKICKTKNFNKTLKILGVKDCGFADEYDTCDRCGKIIHTYNASYTEHLFLDCTIICCDCFSVKDMFVTTGFNMFGCDFELWVREVENDE